MGADTIANRRAIIQRRGTTIRNDGYVNLITSYGTGRDSSEAYSFYPETAAADTELTENYCGNGLFSKIIDTPAEEALKHGFDLNLNDKKLDKFVCDSLDRLDWEEKAATAIKWTRLYGGAVIVMLIDDGGGLEDPVDWESVRSIEELRVYERPLVTPDYASMYAVGDMSTHSRGGKKFGNPEFYYINSIYGSFKVHESRVLPFRNGVLPERVQDPNYRFWGMPEYVRIKKALRDAVTAHGNGNKLLERSVQAVYKMKDLAALLESDDGETQVLKRLDLIDLCRGILKSIVIDKDGEEYDFKTFQFTGVKDVIDSTCNMLSALTNIPQTILFGRSPAGQNATGESDLENYYNYIEHIQRLMLRNNLLTVIEGIFQGGIYSGKLAERPDYKLKFSPLWSLTEAEEATVEQTKAATAQTKAQTAQIYVDMQALDPSEVRVGLADSGEFDVEKLLDDKEFGYGEDWAAGIAGIPAKDEEAIMDVPSVPKVRKQDSADPCTAAAVFVVQDGKFLIGRRNDHSGVCGPGGHIEVGENAEDAARRETYEEFGIMLEELYPIGELEAPSTQYCKTALFLCTDFHGDPECDGSEMVDAHFISLDDLGDYKLFPPFEESIGILLGTLSEGGETDYEWPYPTARTSASYTAQVQRARTA